MSDERTDACMCQPIYLERTSHLNVLDGGVFPQPLGQGRRAPARDPVEADVQVGERVVEGQRLSEAEGSAVAQIIPGEAQPPQVLHQVVFGGELTL